MGVAQLVEHRSPKPSVGSSSLSTHASLISCIFLNHQSYDAYNG